MKFIGELINNVKINFSKTVSRFGQFYDGTVKKVV